MSEDRVKDLKARGLSISVKSKRKPAPVSEWDIATCRSVMLNPVTGTEKFDAAKVRHDELTGFKTK